MLPSLVKFQLLKPWPKLNKMKRKCNKLINQFMNQHISANGIIDIKVYQLFKLLLPKEKIHHGILIIMRSQMHIPFICKTKPIQISMELLHKINMTEKDTILIKDMFKKKLVNGIVILRNTPIWNSFHSERQLDLFKCHKTLILIIRDTYPLLNNSKNIELRLILKYCHML
jgi:hypothetical protein